MNKNVLSGAVAVLALVATSGVAHADTFASATVGTNGTFLGMPIPTGAIYTQGGTVAGNTEAADGLVRNQWLIKGAVSPDCSYYGGSSTSHTMDFGTIGVKTQNNVQQNDAFDMVSAATAAAYTTTAGCNTLNAVTVNKANGSSGLKNTGNTGGYDSNEFQANIPYSAKVSFTGVAANSTAAGTTQSVEATTGMSIASANYGAWRSAMTLTVNAPAPSKALLAGNYEDTLFVELKAL